MEETDDLSQLLQARFDNLSRLIGGLYEPCNPADMDSPVTTEDIRRTVSDIYPDVTVEEIAGVMDLKNFQIASLLGEPTWLVKFRP